MGSVKAMLGWQQEMMDWSQEVLRMSQGDTEGSREMAAAMERIDGADEIRRVLRSAGWSNEKKTTGGRDRISLVPYDEAIETPFAKEWIICGRRWGLFREQLDALAEGARVKLVDHSRDLYGEFEKLGGEQWHTVGLLVKVRGQWEYQQGEELFR